MAETARVALVRASPTTILQDYDQLLDLIDLVDPPPGAGRRYSLRIAIDRRLPFPGSSAPPWQTHGVCASLARRGYLPGSAWLSHPDPDDFHGYRALLERAGLTDTLNRPAAPDDLLVLLAPLRRGPELPFAGASRLSAAHGSATIAVLDGTMVGNGQAASATAPEVGNLLLASRSPAALDTIGARLLGIEPQPLGMIEVVGERALLDQRWRPITGRGGRAARDSFDAWGFEEQQTYTSWLAHTAWGQLFRDYQRPSGRRTGT
jgi:hypothetical protein